MTGRVGDGIRGGTGHVACAEGAAVNVDDMVLDVQLTAGLGGCHFLGQSGVVPLVDGERDLLPLPPRIHHEVQASDGSNPVSKRCRLRKRRVNSRHVVVAHHAPRPLRHG